jgi:hypothetical protein
MPPASWLRTLAPSALLSLAHVHHIALASSTESTGEDVMVWAQCLSCTLTTLLTVFASALPFSQPLPQLFSTF